MFSGGVVITQFDSLKMSKVFRAGKLLLPSNKSVFPFKTSYYLFFY